MKSPPYFLSIPSLLPFWNQFSRYIGYALSMERVNQRTNHLLGENIRKLRIEKQMRNKDVVAQLQIRGVKISTGTYSKVELGLNNPSVDMLIALTEIFSCDFNAFFKK